MTSTHNLVVITGSTRGLGRLIADKFWKAGDDLVLIARQESCLKKVAEELIITSQPTQKIYYYAVDLADLSNISSLVNDIASSAGNPNIVINNAAIQGPIGPLHTNNWQEWQDCLNVCLLAPVQICQRFLPAMIKNHFGRIINISGGGATAPRPNFSSYATAKCGLIRFSETLAHEVGSCGITVNCVAPGIMTSYLTKSIIRAGEQNAGSAEFNTALHLIHKNPHTEERAADLVYLLTTEACTQINGKLISAVWDPWEKLPEIAQVLKDNDVYTLRRIIPRERNLTFE